MKKILMLATGGTIACIQGEKGLIPNINGEQLLSFVPKINDICYVEVMSLMSKDSTDMTSADSLVIARTIFENKDKYDGFVVTHGTDTIVYTASLVNHLLVNFQKPVVFTGSMLPIGMPSSDAEGNLLGAFRASSSNYCSIGVFANGCLIGAKHVIKIDANEIDAFRSANAPLHGEITTDNELEIFFVHKNTEQPYLIENIDTDCVAIYLTPDMNPSFIESLKTFSKVILIGFGAGGIAIHHEKATQNLVSSGTKVYLISQCIFGSVDFKKYAVGDRAIKMGVIESKDRTIPDLLASIMCGEL